MSFLQQRPIPNRQKPPTLHQTCIRPAPDLLTLFNISATTSSDLQPLIHTHLNSAQINQCLLFALQRFGGKEALIHDN